MSTEFQDESASWSAAVDRVAADLVRNGTPPWDAIIRARDIVSEERRRNPVKRFPSRAGDREL